MGSSTKWLGHLSCLLPVDRAGKAFAAEEEGYTLRQACRRQVCLYQACAHRHRAALLELVEGQGRQVNYGLTARHHFTDVTAHQPSSAHGVSASHADSTRLFHCKMKMLIGEKPNLKHSRSSPFKAFSDIEVQLLRFPSATETVHARALKSSVTMWSTPMNWV